LKQLDIGEYHVTVVSPVDASVCKAFEYTHMGSLAFIGNAAVFDVNGLGLSGGLLAVYCWRSVYFAQGVSIRMRVLLAMDWGMRTVFGRGELVSSLITPT
jgi:NADH dehydrogenase